MKVLSTVFAALILLVALQGGSAVAADSAKDKPADVIVSEDSENPEIPEFIRKHSLVQEKLQGRDQPWWLLRAIQRAQDRIVAGENDAIKAYRILLLQAENWMMKLDDTAWQNERNLDATAIYILTGGDVELGYKALQRTRLPASSKILLEAAIAYGEQDAGRANVLLSLVDHRSLPPSMSAQVALAKSMVLSSADLRAASLYLNEARNLAPGTLIEEAAIRRGLRIAAELKDQALISSLIKTYLFRFLESYYFNDFLRNASYALAAVLDDKGMNMMPEFELLLGKISARQRAAIAEYVMRRALISGKQELVSWFHEKVFEETEEPSKTRTRLSLYHLAARVAEDGQTGDVMIKLAKLETTHLSNDDQKLHDAVEAAGNTILLKEKFWEANPRNDLAAPNRGTGSRQDDAITTDDPLSGQSKRLESRIAEIEQLMQKAMP